MSYAWIITWAMEGLEADVGTSNGDWAKASGDAYRAKSPQEQFLMYDDDEVLYYKGVIIGDDYDGFEPLDDFGEGNAGCTGIKYNNQWL